MPAKLKQKSAYKHRRQRLSRWQLLSYAAYLFGNLLYYVGTIVERSAFYARRRLRRAGRALARCAPRSARPALTCSIPFLNRCVLRSGAGKKGKAFRLRSTMIMPPRPGTGCAPAVITASAASSTRPLPSWLPCCW